MLELIGAPGYETISKPDQLVLEHLEGALSRGSNPIVYEVGIGVGATTLAMAERLANRGKIVLFSRESDVKAIAGDLAGRGFTNIDDRWGSAGKTYSSYHFELARGMASGELPAFDLAYLDGGHVFHLDAPATCVLKELCKPGGHIIFDDLGWSLAASPTMNPVKRPRTASEYDAVQIETQHVRLVCATLMDTDQRYTKTIEQGWTALYERRV